MALKMVDLPEHDQMVKNILFIYMGASPDDMAEGTTWYADAYNECARIAAKTGVPCNTVVALVSVVSPSIMWGGNISAPEKIIDLWQRGISVDEWTGFNIYPDNLKKAEAILNGDLSVMRGMKVKAFYANIMGETEPVTIDRWAIRVALDTNQLPADKIVPSGKGVYNALSDAYRDAAELLNQPTPDVQAVTWTVYRNKYNGKVRKEKALKAQQLEMAHV